MRRAASALLLLLPALLLAAGCGSMRKRALGEALDAYNRGVRWGQSAWSAVHVAPGARRAHLARWGRMEGVRVTGYEVRGMRMVGEDRADVTVRYQWYHERRGRLQDTLVQQTWRRKGDAWLLADQRWVGGAPLALVAAPAR